MIWFTSDLHFHHSKVINFCNRPYKSVDEMNEALIHNWNKKVSKKDIVYVLGDFAFCGKDKMQAILSRLNGTKILITGNHDKPAHYMLEAGFDKVFENHKIYLNDAGERIPIYLSHFPYKLPWYIKLKCKLLRKRVDYRYEYKRMQNDGTWLLHGHTHSKDKVRKNMIHVGVDAWNYEPISHKEIVRLIKEGPK